MHSLIAYSNLLAIVAAHGFVQNATIGGKKYDVRTYRKALELIASIPLQFYHVRCHFYVPCAVTSSSKSAIAVPRSVYESCSKRQLSRYSKLLDVHARLAPAHIPPHQRKRPGRRPFAGRSRMRWLLSGRRCRIQTRSLACSCPSWLNGELAMDGLAGEPPGADIDVHGEMS